MMEQGLDSSFESKEDYEMYMRLMSERQRLQKQQEQRRKQRKSVKVRQAQEDRERGFQLYVSGANEERIDDARRRRQSGSGLGTPSGAGAGVGREWRMDTVELRGNDGQIYRSSPHHQERRGLGGDASDDAMDPGTEGSEIGEDIPCLSRDGSRPGTGASVSSVDQETRGVLRMMNSANRDQLLLLRESLAGQIERKVPPVSSSPKTRLDTAGSARLDPVGRSGSSRQLQMHGSKSSAGSAEPGSSASSAIASAIQAENARAKRHSEGLAEHGDFLEAAAASASRPSSRPQSKAGQRLPLSPEVAAECAPPSVLSSSGGAASRRVLVNAAPAYGGQTSLPWAPGLVSHPSAPSAGSPPAASGGAYPSSGGGTPQAARGTGLRQQAPVGVPPTAAFSDEIVDRVGRLDRRKQKALLRVLETLETVQDPGASAALPSSGPPSPAPAKVEEASSLAAAAAPMQSAPAAAPAATTAAASAAPSAAARSGICLRVLSNWGHARQCGLAMIEALDSSAEILRIPPAALSLHGTLGGSTALPRVLEGKANSTNEKLMWLATPCPRAAGDGFEPFEILLNWPPNLASPAALRLWNFNAPDSLDKGVREVVLLKDGLQVWAGEVPRGTGTPDLVPVLAELLPGFNAAPPVAAAPVAAPLPAAVAALVEPAGSGASLRAQLEMQKEKPLWLQGLPVRADLDDESPQKEASPRPGRSTESSSPKPRRKSLEHSASSEHVAEHDRELMLSLQALEQFRSSQSRRFFGEQSLLKRAVEGEDSLTAESPAVDAGAAAQPSLQEAAQAGGAVTAQFGSTPTPAQCESPLPVEGLPDFGEADLVPGQDIAFEGLSIPVRNFDEHDALDGLVADDRADTVMGSSLVASRFSPTQSVVIPTLPRGRSLVFNLVTTWGDQSFVGLAGIEIFDGHGMPVVMKDAKRQVSADPPSINVLPEYEHDPRTADKLFDQVNLTRDDLHVWLAPFSPGVAHTVTVDLERKMGLSMIRIWNYNKSRLHSSRGVRDMEILLDGVPIFVGEIRRAPGVLTSPEEACEHILFTQDEAVLQAVEEHDWLPAHLPVEPEDEDIAEFTLGGARLAEGLGTLNAAVEGRPPTAGVEGASARGSGTGVDGRPITRASTERQHARGSVCSSVTLVIHSTWGDLFYVGLTALELLDGSLMPIPIELNQIDASPRDLNELEGVDEDPRTLAKLLDGVCCTSDDQHMWMAPFVKAGPFVDPKTGLHAETPPMGNLIRLDFGDARQEVAGFNIWNYNKNVEDTCRGMREFSVYCDDRYIATFLCRKAPGHVHFDFKQVVLLDQPPCADCNVRRVAVPSVAPRMPSRGRSERHSTRERSVSREGRRASSRERPRSGELRPEAVPRCPQQYETPLHPCGFIFKLLLLSTWSDMHYVGLGGVELYDLNGRPLRPKRAVSNYGSVRNLPGMENDVRTEDCFVHGAPGPSGRMWLAPFCRQPPNTVELVFDEPTHISCVHFWNYARTPSRGVRDIEIYVDDLLIYQGILRQESASAAASGMSLAGEAVLFTTSSQIVERERSCIYLPSADELVAFFDESGQVEQRGRPNVPVLERPMTAVTANS